MAFFVPEYWNSDAFDIPAASVIGYKSLSAAGFPKAGLSVDNQTLFAVRYF